MQVHAGLVEQQSLDTLSVSMGMECGNTVSAQFPQQSCPVLADTPLKLVKKQTSRKRVTNLYVFRYRFMVFSLNVHKKIELILDYVKPKVSIAITTCNNDKKNYKRCMFSAGEKCHNVAV